MDEIYIDVGLYTALTVDLRNFDFTGISKLVFSARNEFAKVVFEREFTTAEEHQIDITPEESRLLRVGAKYDFDIITTDGKRYKNGDNGNIILRLGCGICSRESQ